MEPKFKFHYTPIPQEREKWLQNRQSGIGGSEVGTILGVNPYESSIQLFYRKVGILPLDGDDNINMFMGRFFEDKIAELWEYYNMFEEDMMENFKKGTKKKFCQKVNYTIKNNHFPHLLANLDRMILPEGKYENAGGYGVLEVKTISGFNIKQWEDGIPPYHLAQLQTYLTITEFEYGEIAMLVDGRKLEVFEFERDEAFIDNMIHETALFWNKVERARTIMNNKFISENEKISMIKEIEPKPDGSTGWEEYLKDAYKPNNQLHPILGTDAMMDIAINWEQAKQDMKEAEERKTLYANQLKYIMGENTEIYFQGNGKITWKPDHRGVRTLRTTLKHFEKV